MWKALPVLAEEGRWRDRLGTRPALHAAGRGVLIGVSLEAGSGSCGVEEERDVAFVLDRARAIEVVDAQMHNASQRLKTNVSLTMPEFG